MKDDHYRGYCEYPKEYYRGYCEYPKEYDAIVDWIILRRKRYIAIVREVDNNGNCQVTPVDVDNLTHEICAFLNAREPKK